MLIFIYFAIFVAIVTSLLLPFSVMVAQLLIVAIYVSGRGPTAFPTRGIVDYIIIGWLVWVPTSLFWSISISSGVQWGGVLIVIPLSYLIGCRVSADPRAGMLLQWLLMFLLSLLSLWGIIQGPETITAKPQGPFNDPNAYAGLLNLLLLPLLANYLATDLAVTWRWLRVFQLAIFGAGALALFLTSSRGATLALILVSIPLFWVGRNYVNYGRKLSVLLIVIVTAYLCAAWAKDGDQDIVLRLVNTVLEGDSARFMLMQAALNMIAEHPLFGSGFGSFRLLYPQYRLEAEVGSAGGWVHNDYLQFWQEAGLPMFLLAVGLLVWLGVWIWRIARASSKEAVVLRRLGYLTGMMAVFIQAATNYMFYFPLIGLLLGQYLAHVQPALKVQSIACAKHRAWRVGVMAYSLILTWLFVGHIITSSVLNHTSLGARIFVQLLPNTSRYDLAYWMSILSPFHQAPVHVMGLELANLLKTTEMKQNIRSEVLNATLNYMEESQRLAPCYLPFGMDALIMSVTYSQGNAEIERGRRQIERNLSCNIRHGLTYYYGGLLALRTSESDALKLWRSSLDQSLSLGDRMLLATAILSRSIPNHRDELSLLANKMSSSLMLHESTPGLQPDQLFWLNSSYKLRRLAGKDYFDLMRSRGANY